MPEDPIRLSAIDFFEDMTEEITDQVKVEFDLMDGSGEPAYLTEVVPCSISPSHEEYPQIVRNAATALQ